MKTMLMALMSFIFCSTLLVAQEKAEDSRKEAKPHEFALKELDIFHEALHPLVHEALPNKDYTAIRAGLEDLLTKAKAIEKARLPRKFASRRKEFQKQSKLLVSQLADMNEVKDKVDGDTLGKKFNDMHETFETLVELVRE